MHKRATHLFKDIRAASMTEFAIILPVLIIMVVGILETGLYFMRSNEAQRALNIISNTLQKYPNEATLSLAQQQGGNLANLDEEPNYVCARAYVTEAEAIAANCTNVQWNISRPEETVEGNAYFVSVKTFVQNNPITGLFDFFPDVSLKAVVVMDGVSSEAVPTGAVMAFDLASCPAGWSAFGRLNGRVVVGADAASSNTERHGDSGGERFVTLTENQIPAHGHNIQIKNNQGDYIPDSGLFGGFNGLNNYSGQAELDHIGFGAREGRTSDRLTGLSGSYLGLGGDIRGPWMVATHTGGGEAFDNRQPYVALNYCKKD